MFEGKHKIAYRWEEDLYVILSQPNPYIPVYVVQREDTKQDRPFPKSRRTQPKERKQVDFSHQRDADLSDDSDNEVYLTQVTVLKKTPIDDQHIIRKDRESQDTSRDKNKQPEPVGVTAENPAPQLQEGGGNELESSESDVEKVERRGYAGVRRPPKKLADYVCQIDNRKSGKKLEILRNLSEETSRPEEKTILLNCISQVIRKL